MSEVSRTRLRLRGPVMCLLATAGLLAGLVVDVVVHWRVTGHEEAGLFDLRNPGHLLVGVSLGVLAGAVCLTLLDARRSRYALAGALTGALLVGAGGLGLGVADSRVREATAHATRDAHPDEPDPAQLEQIQAATEKYQDIDVALAEGYYQASEDYPRQGPHFSNDDRSFLDEFDAARPSALLYTQRLTGEWQLVGLGYGLSLDDYPEQPTAVAAPTGTGTGGRARTGTTVSPPSTRL